MKYAIFGAGFIGKITQRVLMEHDPSHVVEFYDTNPDLGYPAFPNERTWNELDGVFICVPTELSDDTLDISIVNNIIDESPLGVPVFIRSTLPFSAIETLLGLDDLHYVPEFLPELDYSDSLPKSDISMVANIGVMLNGDIDPVVEAFKARTDNFIDASFEEAVIIKLALNTYLATRITFFNELSLITDRLGGSPSVVIDAISKDMRVGNIYNKPGKFYKGKCLPKDVVEYSIKSDLAKSVNAINEKFKKKLNKR